MQYVYRLRQVFSLIETGQRLRAYFSLNTVSRRPGINWIQ